MGFHPYDVYAAILHTGTSLLHGQNRDALLEERDFKHVTMDGRQPAKLKPKEASLICQNIHIVILRCGSSSSSEQ